MENQLTLVERISVLEMSQKGHHQQSVENMFAGGCNNVGHPKKLQYLEVILS